MMKNTDIMIIAIMIIAILPVHLRLLLMLVVVPGGLYREIQSCRWRGFLL